jgi:hypothetical protein
MGDSAFDGFDCPPNPFLDEICGQVGFVAELVVEGTFGFRFGSEVVAVVVTRNAARFWLAARFRRNLATPVPAPLARGVGAVFELLDGLLEERVDSFGSVEFDDSGTTVFLFFTYITNRIARRIRSI